MEMTMDNRKAMLEGLRAQLGTAAFPQPVAFPMMDFSAFNPFSMGVSAAGFQALLYQNALTAMQNYMAPAQNFQTMGEMPCTPLVFPPTPSSVTTPPMTETPAVSPGPPESPDAQNGSDDDLLSFDLGSPGSGTLADLSPLDVASTPASVMSMPGGGKMKKKRKPKPRMADLSEAEAQAKRDSNRESARKSRGRKRERERIALDENEKLRKEVAKLKVKVQVLSDLLLEKGHA